METKEKSSTIHDWELVLEAKDEKNNVKLERCTNCAALCATSNNDVQFLRGDAKSVEEYSPSIPTCEKESMQVSWGF